jgi:small GTP-binding protein
MRAKVILVGDAAVGKTSLLLACLSQSFQSELSATTSPVFFRMTRVVEGESVSLEIWDTGGQENYRALMSLYYRSAHIAILCFTRQGAESASDWAQIVRGSESSCAIVLVLTKADLLSEEELTQVFAEGRRLQSSLQAAEFVVTSAKSCEGVQEAFVAAARIARAIGILPRAGDIRKNEERAGCC